MIITSFLCSFLLLKHPATKEQGDHRTQHQCWKKKPKLSCVASTAKLCFQKLTLNPNYRRSKWICERLCKCQSKTSLICKDYNTSSYIKVLMICKDYNTYVRLLFVSMTKRTVESETWGSADALVESTERGKERWLMLSPTRMRHILWVIASNKSQKNTRCTMKCTSNPSVSLRPRHE
jgi:hypothetical protein